MDLMVSSGINLFVPRYKLGGWKPDKRLPFSSHPKMIKLHGFTILEERIYEEDPA